MGPYRLVLVHLAPGLLFATGCGVDHGSGGPGGGTFAISTTVRLSTWSGMPIPRRRPPLVVPDDGSVATCVSTTPLLPGATAATDIYVRAMP